jgi:hypothetical protein
MTKCMLNNHKEETLPCQDCSQYLQHVLCRKFSYVVVFHHTQGWREGGREGSTAPPHLPKIFPALRIFFLKVIVSPLQKLIKVQIFFKRIELYKSHHVLPFFYWIFNLKPVTMLKKMRLKTTLSLLTKTHRFVKRSFESFKPSVKRKKIK